ncbi:hypothetical protein P691DRAFT_852724 [Macrolepiota fuliginosa MF-IS2]|uniref:Uncharacterized protein n=1 Tax=Macrolepiota fuliginosa MF-IS2 TaxID=1400762 RepID=A0A9P5X101_9AGAR|nr:hypothetical protein P691DRAFT_852724 [Macrolepiota fuliginosa MF-IS2]
MKDGVFMRISGDYQCGLFVRSEFGHTKDLDIEFVYGLGSGFVYHKRQQDKYQGLFGDFNISGFGRQSQARPENVRAAEQAFSAIRSPLLIMHLHQQLFELRHCRAKEQIGDGIINLASWGLCKGTEYGKQAQVDSPRFHLPGDTSDEAERATYVAFDPCPIDVIRRFINRSWRLLLIYVKKIPNILAVPKNIGKIRKIGFRLFSINRVSFQNILTSRFGVTTAFVCDWFSVATLMFFLSTICVVLEQLEELQLESWGGEGLWFDAFIDNIRLPSLRVLCWSNWNTPFSISSVRNFFANLPAKLRTLEFYRVTDPGASYLADFVSILSRLHDSTAIEHLTFNYCDLPFVGDVLRILVSGNGEKLRFPQLRKITLDDLKRSRARGSRRRESGVVTDISPLLRRMLESRMDDSSEASVSPSSYGVCRI